MADYASSLPVRTQVNGDVVAVICDPTITSQQLAVDVNGKISTKTNDGSGTAITSTLISGKQGLDVNIIDPITVTPGTVDESAFTYGTSKFDPIGGVFQDTGATLTAGQTGAVRLTSQRAMQVNLRDSSGNELLGQQTMANSVPVVIASNQTAISVTDTNFPAVVDTNFGTVGASTIRVASQIGNATGAADFNAGATGAQTLRTVANQGAPNSAANAWPISITSGGALNSATNPIFVSEAAVVGTPIDNYNTSASIAANATSNHDYTVTAAKTFYSKQFWASASGKLKVEVQYETAAASGVFNTFWVGFNSTADTNILIPVPTDKTQVTGARIRIIRTNEDKSAQDLYSTISGVEQ